MAIQWAPVGTKFWDLKAIYNSWYRKKKPADKGQRTELRIKNDDQRSGAVDTLAGGVEALVGTEGVVAIQWAPVGTKFWDLKAIIILGTAKRNQPTKGKGHETKTD